MIPHLIQITDRWSKRRFVMKLNSPDEFTTLHDLIKFLKNDSSEFVNALLEEKRVSVNGIKALEDVRTSVFQILDNGMLGEMFEEVYFSIDGHMLFEDDHILFEKRYISQSGYENTMVANIVLNRDDLPFTRNWEGYYKRQWNKDYENYIIEILKETYPQNYNEIIELKNRDHIFSFWRALSKKIYNAPYEIYSRYLERRVTFKTGPETLFQVMKGRGGNCSEKAAALDFIRVNYNLKGYMILSGNEASETFPYTHLRNALNRGSTVFTGDNQKYWEHYANLFIVEDEKLLIDATGGPMPYLFVKGEEAEDFLLQKKSLPVQFIAQRENYYYHDAPLDITYDAFFNMEAFLPDIDLYHVFGPEEEDSPFGLYIRPDLWICPNAYKTEDEYRDHLNSWKEYADLSDAITELEMYADLSSSKDKHILSSLEIDEAHLIEDLRKVAPIFERRCQYVWRDDNWKISYVFCRIDAKRNTIN